MKKIIAGMLFGFFVLAQASAFATKDNQPKPPKKDAEMVVSCSDCEEDKGCGCSKPKPPTKDEEAKAS